MKLQKIVAPTIAELFERQMQSAILSGQISPGDKLPTEAELAEGMNISKSVVHTGLKNLERMGFVCVVPRHGVYVSDWAEFGNVSTLISILQYQGGTLDRGTVASLLQTRCALEGLAAQLFIPRRTNADILELRGIINEFRSLSKVKPQVDIDKLAETACNFHRYICVKSGNNVIPLIVNGFHDVNIALWKQWVRQTGVKEAAEVLDEFLYYITTGDVNGILAYFQANSADYLSKI